MDKVVEHLPNLFIGSAAIAAFSCLARADFNLPLFIFIYMMWGHDAVQYIY